MQRKKAVNVHPSNKRPKLGQHFLADPGAAQKIVEALGDLSQETVVEIGPGRGAITDILAKRAKSLIAIELDRMLATQLRFRYSNRQNVEIVEGDVLAIDFNTLLGAPIGTLADRKELNLAKAKVVGNLPYYITSDILLRLFSFHQFFSSILIMVQKEVADRIAAAPGSRDYGLLSATSQLYARVDKILTLPPGSFAPPPKVHSTVLRLTIAPRMRELGVGAPFISFLRLSFAQKRKTLVNNLKDQFKDERIRAALNNRSLRSDIRAEAISLDDMAALYLQLQPAG